ncbi:hypothetical protein BH10BAC1_BH10BAC1_10180 [soil metagenome]
MPYYTQNKNNAFLINPGVTGTKRLLDARLNYRKQWVGYDGAPSTVSLGLHSRFMKGKMGAGLYLMQDKIGPSKQTNIGASYAYHIRFPDCELSAGVGGIFTKYTLIGTSMFLHNNQDPTIDQTLTDASWVADASAGVYLYNDRFHVGASGQHVMQSTAEFYKSDTTKKATIKYATQVNFTLGYNFSQNPDYVWESTLYGQYVKGAPMMLDYTLRVHFYEQAFVGVSIRLRDAIGIHVGYTLFENYQISYSYDIQIGGLKKYNNGSHEIMLSVSHNIFKTKRGRDNSKFLNQKYGYLF